MSPLNSWYHFPESIFKRMRKVTNRSIKTKKPAVLKCDATWSTQHKKSNMEKIHDILQDCIRNNSANICYDTLIKKLSEAQKLLDKELKKK